MKRVWLVAVFFLFSAGAVMAQTQPATQPAQPSTMPALSYVIVPCTQWGPIRPTTTRADLVAAYGAANVEDVMIEGPEGESYPGTTLFPKEPSKRMQIVWADPTNKQRPELLTITGIQSVWKTAEGLTLGLTVKDLEKINGGPFVFSALGWDYGGYVTSWENGKLAALKTKGMGVRFNAREGVSIPQAISGDIPLNSTHPALASLPIFVGDLVCQMTQR